MAHILSAGKIMTIIPPGGKLNPRYVCSWRSYDRHWMPNAWFWHTFQLMTFAVPVCFGFFLAFCNVFCIHELAKSASFFWYVSSIFQVLALLRAIFSIAKDAEHLSSRMDKFKTLAVFWNERLASCWTKMLQRIRTVLQVTGWRCYNVSGTSYKLLDEDATSYQERLTSCWTKMLHRIRNVLQVTGQRCYNVSGTSCKLLDKDVTTYQKIVIDNAGHRTLLHPPKTPPKPRRKPPKKKTIYKSDNSLAPRGAPSPKTCHEE